MKRSNLSLFAMTLCMLILAFATNADAAPLTFVSAGKGNDAKPCTLDQPCRQFTKALAEVDSGGQIIALDSGGYAPFSIDKSVSILVAPGAVVSIFAGGGLSPTTAITINPIIAGLEVILRGLTLKAGPVYGSGNGILVGASVLHVENCRIEGFANSGISMSGSGQLFVKDSVIGNSGGGVGIEIRGVASGKAKATIDNCRLENNDTGAGLVVHENSEVTISNSVAAGNYHGMSVGSGGIGFVGAPVELNIENCVMTNGHTGVSASSWVNDVQPTLRISNSTITNNSGYGVFAATPFAFSRGNNTIEGNATNVWLGNLKPFTAK